jgi:hypothetical protein
VEGVAAAGTQALDVAIRGGDGSSRARITPYQRSVPPRGGNGKIRFTN